MPAHILRAGIDGHHNIGPVGAQDFGGLLHQVERIRIERDLATWDIQKIREVADELLELELRHGLLVRLLIGKGLITAEEYAGLIAAARVKPPEGQEDESGSAEGGGRI